MERVRLSLAGRLLGTFGTTIAGVWVGCLPFAVMAQAAAESPSSIWVASPIELAKDPQTAAARLKRLAAVKSAGLLPKEEAKMNSDQNSQLVAPRPVIKPAQQPELTPPKKPQVVLPPI